MKTVPHVDISALEHHRSDHIPQPLVSPDFTTLEDAMEASRLPASRKCVYTYEDKYTFARILVSDSLVFDSHFESGNLHSAFRVFTEESKPQNSRHIYDLYMHNDLYTSGHTQWFYFSVSNVRVGEEVTFYIKNFAKADSLFNCGMRPLVYSKKSGKGWLRCGSNIAYFATATSGGAAAIPQATQHSEQQQSLHAANGVSNPIKDNSASTVQSTEQGGAQASGSQQAKKKNLSATAAAAANYTLTFTHTFEHGDDVCYFAYCHPYTYTDLQNYLTKLHLDERRSRNFRRSVLCKSVGGNVCDLLTITGSTPSAELLGSKVVIFLTARIHPGESNASWIMQGMIDFLTSDSSEARQLRDRFIFKVVPMLNPDGVINGNYRTSLAGVDLNRKWNNPDPVKHPTVYHTKELIRRVKQNRPVALVIDIHGHSRKQGAFFYGCVPDKKLMRPSSPPIGAAVHGQSTASASSSSLSSQDHADDHAAVAIDALLVSSVPPNPSNAAIQCTSGASERPGPISWTVSSDPQRGLNLPHRNSSLRDILSWRVKLLPRVLDAVVPIFSLDSCSFKMQKAKAATMRMVAFTELGVDCVYTFEASLAGKAPFHFSASNLLDLGRNMCSGLLTIYPSLAARSSPLYGIPIAAPSLSTADLLSTFACEMDTWRKLYSIESSSGTGASLLSSAGLMELTCTDDAAVAPGDDSDRESGEPQGAAGSVVGKSFSVAANKIKRQEKVKTKDSEDSERDSSFDAKAGGKPWKPKRSATKSKKSDSSLIGDSSWAFDGVGIAYPASTRDLNKNLELCAISLGTENRSEVGGLKDATAAGASDSDAQCRLNPSKRKSKSAIRRSEQSSQGILALLKLDENVLQKTPVRIGSAPSPSKKSETDLKLQAIQALIRSPIRNVTKNKLEQSDAPPRLSTMEFQNLGERISTGSAGSPLRRYAASRLNEEQASGMKLLEMSTAFDTTDPRALKSLMSGKKKDAQAPVNLPAKIMNVSDEEKSPLKARGGPRSESIKRVTESMRNRKSSTSSKMNRLFDLDALGASGLPLNGNIILASPAVGGPSLPTLDDTNMSTAAKFAIANRLRIKHTHA